MKSIRDRLITIRQAEEANIVSINRYLEKQDENSLNALIRREAKIEKMLRDVVQAIIDEND